MRADLGIRGTMALASIVLSCRYGRRPVAYERGPVMVAAPNAQRDRAPAVLLIAADGALTFDARRLSEADLDRVLRMDALYSPGRAVTIAGAAEARFGSVLRALELASLAGTGSITLAAPDLHPLTAFPATTGEAGESFARVAIASDGQVWLEQSPVRDDDLVSRARDLVAARRVLTIVISADRNALHGRVSVVIDTLRRAGVADFLLTTAAPVTPSSTVGAAPPWAASPTSSPAASALPVAGQVALSDSDFSERPRIECEEDSLRNFFPAAAQARGVTGMRVQVRVSVDAGGVITNVQAMEDPGFGLGSAATRAVMVGCHATPGRARDGRPVATVMSFRLNFELE